MALRHDIGWVVAGAVPTAAAVAICQYFLQRQPDVSAVVSGSLDGLVIGAISAARYEGTRAVAVGAAGSAAIAYIALTGLMSDDASLSQGIAAYFFVWVSSCLFAIWYRSRIPLMSLFIRSCVACLAFFVTGFLIVVLTGFYNQPTPNDVLRQTLNGALMLAAGLSALHICGGGGRGPASEVLRGFPVTVAPDEGEQ